MGDIRETSGRLQLALQAASRGLVDREIIVELVALCAVAREHLLVVGPPGTAKSGAVRRIAETLDGRYFEYLLGRFTEPSELFGPIDIGKLKEGRFETQTAGMLPEAEIAFLDEVFLGSTAILNTLLGLINERSFRRGHTRMSCPLRVCVGASNALPEDEALAAFADRFLCRVFVEPIPESRLEELLEAGWSQERTGMEGAVSIDEIDRLAEAAAGADFASLRPTLAHAIRLLRSCGIALSDRRVVKIQRLVAAAAAIEGRTVPTQADLWPIVYALPTAEDQRIGRDVLRELLEPSQSVTLSAAAAEASLGALARAQRVVMRCEEIFEAEGDPALDRGVWRQKLEAAAREIDASFDVTAMPASVGELRKRLVEAIGQAAA